MPIRQITIVGTGLIGGSLALALRKGKFLGTIVGCDREAALEKARNRGAIDKGFIEPGDAVRGSQLVVLATPVLAIVDLIQRLGPALPVETLLTDVGSTKAVVVERALKVFGKNAGKRFLAGHPMAGKESSGVDYADAELFRNAAWFLTPLPGQNLNEGLFAEFSGVDHGAFITKSDLIMHDGKSLEHIGVDPGFNLLPTKQDIASSRDPVMAKAANLLGVKLTAEEAGGWFPFEELGEK